jgi:hypothetical protein
MHGRCRAFRQTFSRRDCARSFAVNGLELSDESGGMAIDPGSGRRRLCNAVSTRKGGGQVLQSNIVRELPALRPRPPRQRINAMGGTLRCANHVLGQPLRFEAPGESS